MKRKIIKLIVMTVVFAAAIVTFGVTLNKDKPDLTTDMAEASLPLIYFSYHGMEINELHGYVQEMDATAMRDTITPVGDDRMLPITVVTYGRQIDGIRYEIRSMDSRRLVAKNDVSDYSTGGGRVTGVLAIQNLLVEDEEYVMVLTLTMDGQEIYYYTRLMQTSGTAKESLEFALQFHDYTFRDDADSFIPTYMDPATGDPTTLDYVDLSCTLKQITWAQFQGTRLTEPVASFKELNDFYNVLTLSYVMSSRNAQGETDFYNVEEYYRLRLTTTRMYVLNFERRMNQIFRGENTFLLEDGSIMLGIRNPDIEYASSETGDSIAFVQEGELWGYDRLGAKIAQVFSFRSAEGMDPRENWDQHGIKIVRVDEAGSVDFVVYGYMNRGEHEGEVGIGVYHFDGLVHTVEEEVFIPVKDSFEILKAEMGQLMYVNEQDILYLMIDRNLYSVNLNTLKAEIVVANLKESCYCASASNRYFAWVEGTKKYSSETIRLMDFADGSEYDIVDERNVYLRPLAFVDEDLIFGAASAGEVTVDAAGNTVFPMNWLKIMSLGSGGHEIIKTYRQEGSKIGSISVEDYVINVNLISRSEDQYVSSGTDAIMNRAAEAEGRVSVGQLVTEKKETERIITPKNASGRGKTVMVTSKAVMQEEIKILSIDERKQQERFYVYVKGDVLLATDNITDAILLANERLGVVVDNNQRYVWMRARQTYQNPFRGVTVNDADKGSSTLVQAVSAMLEYCGEGLSVKELIENGETPKSALESTLKDKVVLDVSGCTVNEIVYYVSEGSPVFALTGSDRAVLVTGYTASLIYYYDPSEGSTQSMSYENADQWFADAGNVFFTYLSKK